MDVTDVDPAVDPFRPKTFDEYVGQEALKKRLRVRMNACLLSSPRRQLDHILLAAPPGSGKTSLVRLIADDMCMEVLEFSQPIDQRTLQDAVTDHAGILFLDEIHNQPRKIQELLLPVLESGYMMTARGRRLECPDLTVIGGTTELHLVIKPLYDRFPLKPKMEPYSDAELGLIAAGMADKAGITLTPEDCETIGRAAAGVPREARQMVIEAWAMMNDPDTDYDINSLLTMYQVDVDGLTGHHLAYLECLDGVGGRAGVAVLKHMLRLHEATVMELERLLVERRFIEYTAGGRELTGRGRKRIRS